MTEILEIKYVDPYFRISLDTGESFRLKPETYNMYSISKGKIIDNAEYQQLKEESDKVFCRGKALNYLAIRSRSFFEMRTYLLKKGFSKDTIDEILLTLKDSGYIDDYDFAVRFINSKRKSKIVGRNVLKRDLFKKGINKNLINKAIKDTGADKIDPEEILKLAQKKMKSLENKKNKTLKLIYFLKQKGFDESEVRTVMKKLDAGIDDL